jgi:hypothetical protein
MEAAADVFLAPVAVDASAAYAGPEPELWIEGDPGFEGGEPSRGSA